MSAGESTARNVVLVAARLLPSAMREQYREQWLADLRDAGEAGIRRSDIALGSLAFAATLDRPPPISRAFVPPEVLARRSRRAAFHSLCATIATAALFVGAGIGAGSLTGNSVLDFLTNFAMFLVVVYAVLAPLAAVVRVWMMRGTNPHVRWAVSLLPIVSIAAVVWAIVGPIGRYLFFNYPLLALLACYAAMAVLAGTQILRGLRTDSGTRGVDAATPLPARVRLALSCTALAVVGIALGWLNAFYLLPLDNAQALPFNEVVAAMPEEVYFIEGYVWVPDAEVATDDEWVEPGQVALKAPHLAINTAIMRDWTIVVGILGLALAATAFVPRMTARRIRLLGLAIASVVVFSNGLYAQFFAASGFGITLGASGLSHAVPFVLGIVGMIAVVHLAFIPGAARSSNVYQMKEIAPS